MFQKLYHFTFILKPVIHLEMIFVDDQESFFPIWICSLPNTRCQKDCLLYTTGQSLPVTNAYIYVQICQDIGIALNIYNSLGMINIFTILKFPIHELSMLLYFLGLFKFFSEILCNFLCRGLTHFHKIYSQYLIFLMLL